MNTFGINTAAMNQYTTNEINVNALPSHLLVKSKKEAKKIAGSICKNARMIPVKEGFSVSACCEVTAIPA